jgi:hypothetical protein
MSDTIKKGTGIQNYRGCLITVAIGGFFWDGKPFISQKKLDAAIDEAHKVIDRSIVNPKGK